MADKENLDEVSKKKLGKYIKAASDQQASSAGHSIHFSKKSHDAHDDGDKNEADKYRKKADWHSNREDRRRVGIKKAVNKLTGTAKVNAREEVEVDEAVGVSNTTRRQYLDAGKKNLKKASEIIKDKSDDHAKFSSSEYAKSKTSKDSVEKRNHRKYAKSFGNIAASDKNMHSLMRNAAKATRKEETEMNEAEAPKTHPSDAAGASKMAMISSLSQKMSAMSKSELIDFFNKSIASIGHEADCIPGGTAEKNKSSVKTSYKEEVAALFGDETLSEEFKEKSATLFEAAVHARLVEEVARLEEALETKLNEQIETFVSAISEQVENYLDYVAEKWMKDNEVAIESQLRADIAEDFMRDLKKVFEDNYIAVPDDAEDIVEDLVTRVEQLEARLNESMNENIELANVIEETKRVSVFESVAEGLTLTESERFKTLSEGVEFDGDLDLYKKKLEIVKEKYFPKGVKSTSDLTEEATPTGEPIVEQPTIAKKYSSYFSQAR